MLTYVFVKQGKTRLKFFHFRIAHTTLILVSYDTFFMWICRNNTGVISVYFTLAFLVELLSE